MKIYTGTSGFAYKEWKGSFYPEKIPPKEMLRFYATRLTSVEINNTFYHMPNGKVLTSWADQVGPGFVFALKAPQVITHIKRLRQVSSETGYLFKALSALGGKLGPVLFQFPKSFRADMAALEDFLALIRNNALCAFEFRSPTWLESGVTELLSKKGCALCTADADDEPAQGIVSTARWGYLRLRRSDYAEEDLTRWVAAVQEQQWEKVFVYFKHEDEGGEGPALAARFREIAEPALLKTGT